MRLDHAFRVASTKLITEYGLFFGPCSVVVWWHREAPDRETQVFLAPGASEPP